MAETDPSSTPVADGDPALADKPAEPAPAPAAPEPQPAQPAPSAEPSDVMAQAEPDDEVAEAKASEKGSAVAQFLAEEKKIEELVKALDVPTEAEVRAALVSSITAHMREDEEVVDLVGPEEASARAELAREKDCPGSDPRCTP